MIWLYSKAQRLKSLLLILVYTYTALQSGPGPCFQSHTSGKVWFLDILYLSSLGVLDQGYLVFFIFFLSDKCLPTLPNSAEMSPILWRFSPAIQTEFCSLYVGNTHIVILTLISLHSLRTHTLSPATSTIMVRSMPKETLLTVSGLMGWVTLKQAHPFLLSAVELMLTKISCICSQSSLYQLYLLLSLFNLINVIYNDEM